MFKAVYLQVGATIIAVIAASLFLGWRGAVSAALGGAACFLPNLVFAMRLHLVSKRDDASYMSAFFVGEFFKIASTVGLLVLAQALYRDVHWLALFLGLVLALKANLFAFLVKT